MPDSASKPYPETESSSWEISKVAEAVATYAASATPKLKTPVRTIAGLAADDEVWSFVQANDLLPHLEMAIRLARKTFIDIRQIWLSYEPDPELPKFNSIVIWVKAHGTVEKVFAQDQNYTSEFVEAVPREKRHQITLLVSVA
ncbi:MAG: hypothetical protein ONB44_05845 [candidate division KSB1 bacterium]|nr:hypothetical protein [candidate division KSB1 bacterium]MDZ7301649.1 hypothetical protein [candidate division KSB1 bacterium]MDZ7313490.1 hypothetical protein [candidate division KSB1 bacterium]